MALININAIINPITDEIRNKAWQIVNDVSNRVWNIVNGITAGLEMRVGWVINGVKNHLEWIINGVRSAVDYTRIILENRLNDITWKINNIVGAIVNGINDLRYIVQNIVGTISHVVSSKIDQLKFGVEFAINNIIGGAVRTITGMIGQIIQTVQSVISNFNTIKDTIINVVQSGLSNAISNIATKVSIEFNNFYNRVTGFINDVRNSIQYNIDRVKDRIDSYQAIISNKINDVREYISNTINYVRERVEYKITEIKDNISNFISSQVENLRNKFNTTLDNVRDFLRDKIDLIRQRIEDLKQYIQDKVRDTLNEIEQTLNDWRKIIEKEFEAQYDKFSDVFGKLANNQYTSFDAFKYDFERIGGHGGILSNLLGMIVIGSTYLNSAVAIGSPMAQNIRNLANEEFTPSLLSPITIIELMAKDKISDDRAYAELRLNGLNKERSDLLKASYENLLSPGDIQIAFLRGEINESDHDILLRRLQYSDASIELFKQLYVIIPPIADLITMSVREVFSPETAERFGQFEDFPTEFAHFAKQQGLSEEWAKRYWASHWSLPSPTQGFEMLHRRIIDENDLKLLLKALDIMPFWREKLIQLSYNPLTRVDVRRMHKVGVLKESEVYESYLDIGYTPENARRLTEFTVKLNMAENKPDTIQVRELTRNIIEQAYSRGIISKDEAINRLVGIHYSLSDAEFLIRIQDGIKQVQSTPDLTTDVRARTFKMILNAYATRAIPKTDAIYQLQQLGLTQLEAGLETDNIDYEISLKLKQRYVESVQDLYTNWTIDKPQLFIYLNDLGFNQGEIEHLLMELDIIRETRTKLPTKEDLKRWVKSGITTIEEYINDLKGQGFADIYIQRYVAELGE